RLIDRGVGEGRRGGPPAGRDRGWGRTGPTSALADGRLTAAGLARTAGAPGGGRRIDRLAIPGHQAARGDGPVVEAIGEGGGVGRLAPEGQAGRGLLEDVAGAAVGVLALDRVAHRRAE